MSYKHVIHDGNMVMMYHSNTPPKQKSFHKPIQSKIGELSGSECFYYLAAVPFTKTMQKAGLGHLCTGAPNYSQFGAPRFFTKRNIDCFPRHIRRGGEYGHDAVRVLRNDGLASWAKSLCKVHKIHIEYK